MTGADLLLALQAATLLSESIARMLETLGKGEISDADMDKARVGTVDAMARLRQAVKERTE